MIFVTVGTQLAFDRLIGAMDRWAGANPGETVFAQTGPSRVRVLHMRHAEFVTPDAADDLFRQADLVVAHAGMGSILTALKYRKPIIVMPRQAGLGEHRSEHQNATVQWLCGRPGISVATEEEDLFALLDDRGGLVRGSGIPEYAAEEFTSRLRNWFETT